MKSSDYNTYLSTIKQVQAISDAAKRKEMLGQIKARLLADYGLNDSDAKNLINKCD
jgi:hypothetical protein